MFWRHPDGTLFHVIDRGEGIPLVFQHGLGGSAEQVDDLLRDANGFRLISIDCRAHGKTERGTDAPLTTDMLASDICCFIQQAINQPFFIGGLSLGALLAIKVAITRPQQIRGIVLLRPAWPDAKCSTDFGALRKESDPDYAGILSPEGGVKLSDLATLPHRTLVLGMPSDPLHPADFASDVARSFMRGSYEQVPNKVTHGAAHKIRVQKCILKFLKWA